VTDISTTVTVAHLAAAKGIPADVLARFGLRDSPLGVLFGYQGLNGVPARTRIRHGLRGAGGSRWADGNEPIAPYLNADSQRRAAELGYHILVEGESDCWAAWLHGFPALGIPGPDRFYTITIAHLAGVNRVYLQVEAENPITYPHGVARYLDAVADHLRTIGFAGDVLLLRHDGVDDLADLNAEHSADFAERLRAALDATTPTDPMSTTGKTRKEIAVLDAIDTAFDDLDWENLEAAHDAADHALIALSEPVVLGKLLRRLEDTPELVAMCEHFLSFTKLVLHDNPRSGLRIRLHLFGEEMVEEAHNHRNSFTTRILRGGYRHFLYGNVEQLWDENRVIGNPSPRLIHDQRAGHVYTIHHAFVHSTYATPGTVSLVVQGPRVRQDFKIHELKTGVSRNRLGADEAMGTQEDGERLLNRADVSALREQVIEWGLAE